MRWTVVMFAALMLEAPAAHASGVIRGTLWSTRTESRRADTARAREAARRARQPSVFDYLGTPALRRPSSTRVVLSTRAVPDSTPSPRLRDAVISVRRVPTDTERRLAESPRVKRASAPPRVVVRRSGILPRVVALAPGQSMEIENRDRVWHRLYTSSAGGMIELGAVAPGKVRIVKPRRAGILSLVCGLHSNEFGFLLVQSNHVFARPDSLGRFALPALPPGRYVLTVWDPDRGTRRRTVELPARRDVVCNLSF